MFLQAFSSHIQFMAQHTRPTLLSSEAHSDLVRSSFGPVLLSGSCVQHLLPCRSPDPFALQFAELSNLSAHLTVRNLRPPGTKKRAIPHGYGFGLVSFPNYFFESVAWAAVAYMSGSWAGK
jgi:hypothetical protein